MVGTGDLEEAGIKSTLVETSVGGIYYFDDEGAVVPYLSLFGVMSDTSKIPDLSNQGGLRFGVGVEVPISGGIWATIGADYLLPVYDAKTDSGLVEADLEGLAVRIGVIATF